MHSLTCPIPNNINPLQSNGFMFTINKLPEISFFCQEATLPSLDLPRAVQATPLVDDSHPGDKVSFGDMTITFLIDGGMANYKAVADWMMGLGFPRDHTQYTNWINSHKTFPTDNENMAGVSDGVLQILNSSNNPLHTIVFRDMWPTALSSLQLQATTSDTMYLTGTATFVYTMYEFS